MRKCGHWLGYALLLLCAGCMERTTATLPPTARVTDFSIPDWEYQGSFGGAANLVIDDTDPWLRRYEDGKFLTLAGLDVTADEVWVCDLGISRIQIFDHNGRYLRSIGSGVTIAGTLATDEELYTEEQTIVPSRQQKWEETPDGQRWVQDKVGLFKAADVKVTDEGYWLTDQVMTSGFAEKGRAPACRLYTKDGRIEELPVDGVLLWPNYLAATFSQAACGEDWGNVLWMGGVDEEGVWQVKRPTNFTTGIRSIMQVRRDNATSSRFDFLLDVAGNAGNDLDKFNRIGGMEFFQDKLLVCDRKNRRIKVFNAHLHTDQWSQQIKIIGARKRDGGLRFMSPRDLTVDTQGLIYLLDDELREIAILSPDFDRIGSIAGESMSSPRALSLSPDGTELFVSDPGTSVIHHYAAH
jgi:hypothetical protein